MQTIGKILFYNEGDGKGILITSGREKINFSIQEWNDFETMPSLGLEVHFTLQNDEALGIASVQQIITQDIPSSEDTITKDTEDNLNTVEDKEITPKTQKKQLSDDKKAITDLLDNSEENLELLHDKITLTLNISDTMNQYFQVIQKNLLLRSGYKKVEGRLNYIIARRFIWTTFNNLTEIDSNILTPRIKSISDDLKIISQIYDDFIKKIRYPSSAFEEIFLSCQTEYKMVKKTTDETIEKLNLLDNQEKLIGLQRKLKNEEINKTSGKDKEKLGILINELKSLNGVYVDIVHMMAELKERQKHNLELLYNFEKEYKEEFFENFLKESESYKKDLLAILDAQAYLVDNQLWQEAKVSKSLKKYFKDSLINGELNTKTYLKYYLSTLDSDKANQTTKELYEFYEHLLDVQKDYILIVTNSMQEAMEYEAAIKNSSKSNNVKSFIDEIGAIKWAMKNYVKVLVLEDILKTTTAENFLNVYHNNILSKPKIIIIGDKPKSNSSEYVISKLLSKNISPKVIAANVNEMINA